MRDIKMHTLVLAGSITAFFIQPLALAQSFAVKPIRIVTSDAGGGSDLLGRYLSPGMSSTLGQPIVVDNRGGGVIAGEIVSRSPPDGHTLILYGNTLWILPLLRSNVPYDTLRDFAPITLASSVPNILVVHPSLPVKSVKELIALAKAKPGTLDYASAALGASNHIAAELFKSMAKVDLVRVPYKGLGAALSDVMSGHVPILFSTSSAATVHVQANRLRALGVSTPTRLTAFPDLPTIAEAALPGYESMFHNGILAPAGTPPAIIGQLNQAITRALANPQIKDKIEATGSVVVASSPDEFAQKMRREIETIGKVIKEAGIRGD